MGRPFLNFCPVSNFQSEAKTIETRLHYSSLMCPVHHVYFSRNLESRKMFNYGSCLRVASQRHQKIFGSPGDNCLGSKTAAYRSLSKNGAEILLKSHFNFTKCFLISRSRHRTTNFPNSESRIFTKKFLFRFF